MRVRSLGREDALGEGLPTHSRTLACRMPQTEEPGGLPVHRVTKSWTEQRLLSSVVGWGCRKGAAAGVAQLCWCPLVSALGHAHPSLPVMLRRLPLLQLHWRGVHASSYLEVVSSRSLDHDGPHAALRGSPLLPGGLQEQAKADSPSCLAPAWSHIPARRHLGARVTLGLPSMGMVSPAPSPSSHGSWDPIQVSLEEEGGGVLQRSNTEEILFGSLSLQRLQETWKSFLSHSLLKSCLRIGGQGGAGVSLILFLPCLCEHLQLGNLLEMDSDEVLSNTWCHSFLPWKMPPNTHTYTHTHTDTHTHTQFSGLFCIFLSTWWYFPLSLHSSLSILPWILQLMLPSFCRTAICKITTLFLAGQSICLSPSLMLSDWLKIFSSHEGNGNPLQYSCLENPMGRRAW